MKRIFIFGLFLIILGCSLPENLGVPSWETNLKLYLINSEYLAVDLAESDSNFVATGDTLMLYTEINESQEIEITLNEVSENAEEEIGDVELDDPESRNTFFTLSELAPDLNDGYVPAPGIPEFILPTIIRDDIESFDEFLEVTCSSGELRFTVTNNTAVWMGNIANNQPFELILRDADGNEITSAVFSEDIPPLAAESISASIDLSNMVIVNEIQVEIAGGSRGTDGEAATIDTSANVDIVIEIFDVTAINAIAKIPAQDIDEVVGIELDGDVILHEAVVAEGDYKITVNFSNSIDLDIGVVVSCDDLILAGDQDTFSRELVIPRSGGNGLVSDYTEIIDISGATIGHGAILDSIFVNISGFTNDTGDDYREVDSSDFFASEVNVEALEFSLITGTLPPREEDPIENEEELDIEYPYISGDFSLVGYSEIRFEIDTPVYTEMDMNILAKNETNNEEIMLLDLDTGLVPSISIPAGSTTIIFDSEHYNINEMVSILPESFSYNLIPIIGDETEVFTFEQNDKIEANIFIESELDILADCVFIPKDEDGKPNIQEIDTESFTEKEHDAFVSGQFRLNYENTMGVSVGAKLLISSQRIDDFEQIIASDPSIFTIIDIPLISQTTDDNSNEISVNLTKSQLDVLLADKVYIVPKLQVYSEAGTPISGSMKFRGIADLVLKVNNDLVED